MGRFSWRWLLPTIQLMLFALLVGTGCPYVSHWLSTTVHEAFSKSVGSCPPSEICFEPSWIDGPPTAREQLAYGLSYPATVTAEVGADIVTRLAPSLLRNGFRMEFTRHVVAIITIVPFWYLIGACIDSAIIRRRRPFSRVSSVVLICVLLLFGPLSLVFIVLTLIFSPSQRVEFAVIQLFVLAWGVTLTLFGWKYVVRPLLNRSRWKTH